MDTMTKDASFPSTDAIETVNFHPQQDFLRIAQSMLWEVFWQAPSDAILKVRFEKRATGFEGLLQVSGVQKSFSARSRAENLLSLPEILCRQMCSQILEWKKTRVFS